VLLRQSLLGVAVGAAAGAASAIFLLLLDRAIALREGRPAVVYLLPVAGVVLGLAYERWGKPIDGGTDRVLATILTEEPPPPALPLRMAPMVLVGTVLTHLFGGSAGREGTAVQMGASLADALSARLRLDASTRRHLLVAGMAGGFGSVFGTPLAGAMFGIEVARPRSGPGSGPARFRTESFVPALVASLVGDQVTRRLGVTHTAYPRAQAVSLGGLVIPELVLIGIAMGLVTIAFVVALHATKNALRRLAPRRPVRMFLAGVFVAGSHALLGTGDYLGLGVPTILRAFGDPALPWYAFALKLGLTAVTLGAGFLGGEVTPLFFVGATLGSVLARSLGLPIALGAGVGMAAVFGAAAKTPVALTLMAVELLGLAILPHAAVVAVVAYLVSSRWGIYGGAETTDQ